MPGPILKYLGPLPATLIAAKVAGLRRKYSAASNGVMNLEPFMFCPTVTLVVALVPTTIKRTLAPRQHPVYPWPMTDPKTAELKANVEAARKAFLAELAACQAALRPYGFPPETALDLTAVAEEFGEDFVLNHLQSTPERIGLAFPSSTDRKAAIANLKDPISRLLISNDDLNTATVERERHLITLNPNHRMVYNHYGREMTVDFTANTWTYVDSPHLTYALTLEERPNRHAPVFDKPKTPVKQQDRNR